MMKCGRALTDLNKEMQSKAKRKDEDPWRQKQEGRGSIPQSEYKSKRRCENLPSGLQYKVIKEGTGKIPKATDTVTYTL